MSPFPVRKRCLSRTAGCNKGIGIEYGDLDFHIMHSSLFVRDRPVRHAKAQLVTGPFLETRMGFEEHRLLKIDEVTRMCAISQVSFVRPDFARPVPGTSARWGARGGMAAD